MGALLDSPSLCILRLKIFYIHVEVFSGPSRKWILLWQKLPVGHGGVPKAEGEILPAGPAPGLPQTPSNHREISLFICAWNYYFTQLAHSLLYRGQVWFQLMQTFLSSPLALPLEWLRTRGAELPTVLDKECLQDSCLTHVSPRRDHRASALTPKSQRRNPMSWHPPLPSNDGMAWYLDPPCLALSTFHSHL